MIRIKLQPEKVMEHGERWYLWRFAWWPLFEVIQWRRYTETANGS